MLLGPPASGKGTQAEKIKLRYGIPTASPGAMLRDEMRRGTELGIEADRLTRDGSMVPDSMVIRLVGQWLEANTSQFIFDGFPRTLGQAEALDEMLARNGQALDAVLFFDLPAEVIASRVLNRLSCTQCGRIFAIGLQLTAEETRCPECGGVLERRSDDTLEALQQRMAQYREKTDPLVGYYREKGLLRTLKAAEHPEAVFEEIVSILDEPGH